MEKLIKVAPGKVKIISNVRETFDKTNLLELSKSIKENGLLQPITVCKAKKGNTYELVIGQRRLLASRMAKQKEISAILVEKKDSTIVAQTIENTMREDLSIIEEAKAYVKMAIDEKMTPNQIAVKVSKPIKYVKKMLLIQNVIKPLIEKVIKNKSNPQILFIVGEYSHEIQKMILQKENSWLYNSDEQHMRRYLLNNYSTNLSKSGIDVKDNKLDEKAGACIDCPKKKTNSDIFDDGDEYCLDLKCLTNKKLLTIRKLLKELPEDALLISSHQGEKVFEGKTILEPKEYEIKSVTAQGIKTYPAIIVDGDYFGKKVTIVLKKDIKREEQKQRVKSIKEGKLDVSNSPDRKYQVKIESFELMTNAILLRNYKKELDKITKYLATEGNVTILLKMMYELMDWKNKEKFNKHFPKEEGTFKEKGITKFMKAAIGSVANYEWDSYLKSESEFMLVEEIAKLTLPKETFEELNKNREKKEKELINEELQKFKEKWNREPVDLNKKKS